MSWERNLVILGMVIAAILLLAAQWPAYWQGIAGAGWLLLAIVYAVLTGAKKWL